MCPYPLPLESTIIGMEKIRVKIVHGFARWNSYHIYHGGILINIGDIDTRGRKKKYLSQEKGRETRF